MPRFEAALRGAREVGFTVLSMSLSLIAVFIPILLMGGIVGRLFREFAVTLSVAILVSLAGLADHHADDVRAVPAAAGRRQRTAGAVRARCAERVFERGAGAAMSGRLRLGAAPRAAHHADPARHASCLNIYLFIIVPKGFFPQQDTGRLIGGIQADQSISFQLMQQKLTQFVDIVQQRSRRWRASVVGFTGGGPDQYRLRLHLAEAAVAAQRSAIDQVIARLRRKLAHGAGRASCSCRRSQDIRVGGRQSNAHYQYTLQADDLDELHAGRRRSLAALQQMPDLTDVNSDQQDKGLETDLHDRPRHRRAARPQRQPDRQHALRRLRPAPGLDHLQRAQPVSRRHGGRAAVTGRAPNAQATSTSAPSGGAVSGTQIDQRGGRHGRRGRRASASSAAAALGQRCGAQPGDQLASPPPAMAAPRPAPRSAPAAETMVPLAAFTHLRPRQHAAGGQPPGPVRRHHDLLQPAAGQVAQRRRPARSTEAHAQHRHAAAIHGSFQGTAEGLPGTRSPTSRC